MATNPSELGGFSDEQLALLASLLEQDDAPPRTDEIGRRRASSDYPLSAGQRRLWFLDRLESGSHYNENLSVRVNGDLDHRIVVRVLQEILRRHEAMRSTFALVDGEPVQCITPSQPVQLPVIDLRAVPEPIREAEANRLAIEEARKPFKLDQGPLWRFALLCLGERDYIVLVVAHHIAMDGSSATIFWKEFGLLYEAFITGRPSPLPEPSIQYADYAAWQTEWNESESASRELNYWTGQLAGAPPLLELPADRSRHPVQTFRGASHFFTLPHSLLAELKTLGRREEATSFMVLLAALQVLIARYTQKDDITVGTPIANRSHPEIE